MAIRFILHSLKAEPVSVMTVQKWSENASELRDFLQTTDVDVFRVATDNIHDYTETVSCYISYICVPLQELEYFQIRNHGFTRTSQPRSGNGTWLSGLEMNNSTGWPDTLCSNQSELQKSRTQKKLENCYTGQ